jgi:RND family efflux transporter MFP subunit
MTRIDRVLSRSHLTFAPPWEVLLFSATPCLPAPVAYFIAATLVAAAGALLPPPAAAQGNGAARVLVDEVREVPLAQTAPVIGRLVATQSGVVAARVGAPVEAFLVEVGDRVERDQTLALLDDEVLSARRAQAAAALAEARARLATRREQLGLARQELQRLERLKSSAAFSQARYEDQRQEVAIAAAEVASAEASIDSAQADLQLAGINLKHAEVRAPYAGAVTQRMVEAGAYVGIGEPLVRMLADRSLEVEAQVPFNRLAVLKAGDVVDIELEDGSRHTARIRAVLPQENPQTRTRMVRAVPRFDAPHRPLASGQSVTVHVPLGDARNVLSVHKDAIIRGEGKATVFVHVDGKAEIRPVQLGAEVGNRFEVLEGLEPGAQAVVRGNERLRPGDDLKIEDTGEGKDGSAAG